ncbi:MAG TPA: hypothetical protein VFT56_00985 [Sphingomonas sp.]|nr:hypothetical protein [Sphingomonas sp.]
MTRLRLIAMAVEVITVAALVALGLHWRGQRDDLLAAVSASSHAINAKGAPRDLGTAEAVKTIRGMGLAIDTARRATSDAMAKDAQSALTVERADAGASEEVSTDVLDQLARTRADLADARALADKRLRALTAARPVDGGGSATPVPYDPEPACRAYAGSDCDGLLAKLAAADEQTQQLLGWQRFYPAVKANHDAASAKLPERDGPSVSADDGGLDVSGGAGRAR